MRLTTRFISVAASTLTRCASPALAALLLACGGNTDAPGPDSSAGGAIGTSGAPTSVSGGPSSGGPSAGSGAGGSGAGQSGGSSAGGRSGGSGSTSGGSANGGTAGRGSAGSGGKAGGGTAGAVGTPPTNEVFSQCRFHFGTIDSKAKTGGASMISQLDYFTPGWMQGETFDHGSTCTEGNAGGVLASQVPVLVSYIAAAYVKRHLNVCDCNVTTCGTGNDLCHVGAQNILQNLPAILNSYKSYSQGFASCYGTTRPIIFEMEPDWYQYTSNTQTQAWTAAQAGQIMGQLVAALKTSLPNARFSIDVSPWVAPQNGMDNGAAWFSNFDMTAFTFVNTSGGGTNANTAKIRSSNNMTWAGLSQVTGKPILADTGYGANGVSVGHDANWDVVANVNARIADGVVSIAQYNPSTTWGTTIGGVRAQLNTPKFCP